VVKDKEKEEKGKGQESTQRKTEGCGKRQKKELFNHG
jgi:hypothetical protein